MKMTPSELSNFIGKIKKAVDNGFFEGKLSFERNHADSYEVSGSCYLEVRMIYFEKVPRLAKCGHEIEFGVLGCSCD